MHVSRSLADALDVITVSHDGIEESVVTSRASAADPLSVFRSFPPVPSSVLNQFAFGGCSFHDDAVALMDGAAWPMMWLHGDGCSGEDLSGTQAFVVSGTTVKPIMLDGVRVGCVYEDALAEHCYLGGILPADPGASRMAQARSVFERIEQALSQAGMGFSHVIRTWLFLEELLDWYDDFNVVRNEFFTERGVFDGVVPASTGIGAANPAGAALITGAIALKPKDDRVSVFPVASPLQCPALDYKSSFSRAVEVSTPDRSQIYVSGTASIAPDGRSVYLGDVDKQIDLTMRVAGALLESRQMGWGDLTRMIAYFKDMADGPRLAAYCREHELPRLPVTLAHAAVCRDDLLFEIEVDAVRLVGESES